MSCFPEAKPKLVHDYLLTIGPDETTPDILAYFRENDLPLNVAFMKASPIPRKAAFAIKEGQTLAELVQALLVKAGLAAGHITVMDLRPFDEFDRGQFDPLGRIEGFSFTIFSAKNEHLRNIEGIDFT